MFDTSDRLPVARPFLYGGEVEAVAHAVRQGWWSGTAPPVGEFELAFSERIGAAHAVAVSSGTAALQLVAEALELGPGDEVIVPAFCMISPIAAVLRTGARLVLVDADSSWNLDPAGVAAAITDHTRLVLGVHTYGHPFRLGTIAQIAASAGVPLVEDAAEALGGCAEGINVGRGGVAAVFSTYANKTISSGEGGMVTTDDSELAERLRWTRNLCFGHGNDRFLHTQLGHNFRMSALCAALGQAQLVHLDRALDARQHLAARYRLELANVPGLELPPAQDWATHTYWVFGVLVDNPTGVAEELGKQGIETRQFFRCVADQPVVSIAERGEFPVARRLASRGLYLPLFPGMSTEDVSRVAMALRAILSP
tara:strand:+ start:11589 stop:12692 length:1104 start_codon:yes stop_codon:yes gene_type:complete